MTIKILHEHLDKMIKNVEILKDKPKFPKIKEANKHLISDKSFKILINGNKSKDNQLF